MVAWPLLPHVCWLALIGPYWPLFVTHHPPDPHVHAHHPHLCLSSHILAHTLVFVLASPPSPHCTGWLALAFPAH